LIVVAEYFAAKEAKLSNDGLLAFAEHSRYIQTLDLLQIDGLTEQTFFDIATRCALLSNYVSVISLQLLL
jgi:hypothetical protein